jgi:hypothetical protein
MLRVTGNSQGNHSVLKLVALLPFLAGCGPVSVAPLDPTAALADADFDGWQGNTSQHNQSIDPAQAGGILSAILDRVESIEAKLRPPRPPTQGSSQTVESAKPAPAALQPAELQPPELQTAARGQKPSEGFPPPAPPAEPLAASQGEPGPVETLDIPKGWTGAAVYHAATCPHCPALLAGLRSRATKVSGNYLRIDGCWFLLVDWNNRPDLNRPAIGGLPAVLYFVDGHERVKDRVVGFGNGPGELDAIIARHPLAAKRAAADGKPLDGDAYYGSLAQSNCPCGPGCACLPGSQCGCLGGNYGSSVSVVPARHSAGISLFGMPILGGSLGTYPTYPTCRASRP